MSEKKPFYAERMVTGPDGEKYQILKNDVINNVRIFDERGHFLSAQRSTRTGDEHSLFVFGIASRNGSLNGQETSRLLSVLAQYALDVNAAIEAEEAAAKEAATEGAETFVPAQPRIDTIRSVDVNHLTYAGFCAAFGYQNVTVTERPRTEEQPYLPAGLWEVEAKII